MSDGSYFVWDIKDYVEYIVKNDEKLVTIPPIHVYINRINNRYVFKIKDEDNTENDWNNEIIWQHKKINSFSPVSTKIWSIIHFYAQ